MWLLEIRLKSQDFYRPIFKAASKGPNFQKGFLDPPLEVAPVPFSNYPAQKNSFFLGEKYLSQSAANTFNDTISPG